MVVAIFSGVWVGLGPGDLYVILWEDSHLKRGVPHLNGEIGILRAVDRLLDAFHWAAVWNSVGFWWVLPQGDSWSTRLELQLIP
ncbi:hypothetical protein Dimus_006437 [Dionaea muscipula]